MNLTALIAKTRRLVNEASARLWSDADVTTELNNALYEAETAVARIAQGEFLEEAVINTSDGVAAVTGGTWYLRPTYEPIQVVRIKESATGDYRDLDKLTLQQVYNHVSGSTGANQTRAEYGYALRGKYMLVRPAPPAGIAAGLLVLYWDKLGLSAAADTPRLPVALHHRLCYRAAELLLKDSKDVSGDALAQIQAEWAYYFLGDDALRRLFKDHYYDRQPVPFTPGIAYSE